MCWAISPSKASDASSLIVAKLLSSTDSYSSSLFMNHTSINSLNESHPTVTPVFNTTKPTAAPATGSNQGIPMNYLSFFMSNPTLPERPTNATIAVSASTRWCHAFAFNTLLSVLRAIFIVAWKNHSFSPTEARRMPTPNESSSLLLERTKLVPWEWATPAAWTTSGWARYIEEKTSQAY